MPDGNSDVVPPESIPNSEVKRVSGDGSVGSPHVRVAHRQAPNYKEARSSERAFFVSVLSSESLLNLNESVSPSFQIGEVGSDHNVEWNEICV